MGAGQTNVTNYNRDLCNFIHEGKAKPSFIMSHELSLKEASDSNKHFDKRENVWIKVLLKLPA
jgi:glutathione-independent formaldehyde dehydrogenase